MLVRLLTTKLCKDSCIRRNDEVSDHRRPPLADEAQRNSGISLIVVNIRTSRIFYKIGLDNIAEVRRILHPRMDIESRLKN